MTPEILRLSLEEDAPPENLSPLLCALWFAAKNQWDAAHEIVQAEDGKDAAWVHAHLHRIEGDRANASYWYRLAGKVERSSSLTDEWEEIVTAL